MTPVPGNLMDKRIHVHVPEVILEDHPNCFGVEVRGECMEPTVSNGSIILVDPDVIPPKDGSEMAVLEVERKRFICRPMSIIDQVLIFHDNRKYRTLILSKEQVRIIGVVVWVQKSSEFENRSESC